MRPILKFKWQLKFRIQKGGRVMKGLIVGVLLNEDKSVFGFRVFRLTDTFHKQRKDKRNNLLDFSMYSLANNVKNKEIEILNMEVADDGINILDGDAKDLPRYLKGTDTCIENNDMNIVLCRVVVKQKTVGYVVLEPTSNYSYIKAERMPSFLHKYKWYNIQKSDKNVRGKRGNLYVQDHDALDKKRVIAKKEKEKAATEKKQQQRQKAQERKEKEKAKKAEIAEKLALEKEKMDALKREKGAPEAIRARKDIPTGNVIPVKVVPNLQFTAADLHATDTVKSVKKSNKDLKSSFIINAGPLYEAEGTLYMSGMPIAVDPNMPLKKEVSEINTEIANGKLICMHHSVLTNEVLSADYVGKRGVLQQKVAKATLLNSAARSSIVNISGDSEDVKTGKDIVITGLCAHKILDDSGVDGMYDALGVVKKVPCTFKFDQLIDNYYYSNLDTDDLGAIFDYCNDLIFSSHEMGRLPKVPIFKGSAAGVATVRSNSAMDLTACGRAPLKTDRDTIVVTGLVMPYNLGYKRMYSLLLSLMLTLFGTLSTTQYQALYRLIEEKTGLSVYPLSRPNVYYWCPSCNTLTPYGRSNCAVCFVQEAGKGEDIV